MVSVDEHDAKRRYPDPDGEREFAPEARRKPALSCRIEQVIRKPTEGLVNDSVLEAPTFSSSARWGAGRSCHAS
jgi:hypothetical protein